MPADRAKVIGVIKEYTDALGRKGAGDASVEQRDDPARMREALAQACQKGGISVEEYAAALQADPTLAELERQSTTGAIVGPTDPGPYDAISRESPSGQPGDLTKPRSIPRSEAPGGS